MGGGSGKEEQFLVCFQVRGNPRDGQGDPGAMGRPDYIRKAQNPREIYENPFSKALR